MMSPSGLKYKLNKMANSIVLGRTLQSRTSRAEEPLGSELFLAPRKKNALQHTTLFTHECLYKTHQPITTNACAHTHHRECITEWLLLRALSNFLLFPFILIKARQINCSQLCTNPFFPANQGCLNRQETLSPASLCKWVFKH
jgi:hypothetical protein